MRDAGIGDDRERAASTGDAQPVGAFVTRLTSEGRGAIAVLRIWGPRAPEIVDAAFRPDRGARLAETPPGRLRLGRLGRGLGDEVVVVKLGGEPPAVEVQCHGGDAAVRSIVEALCDAGATIGDEPRLVEQFVDNPITSRSPGCPCTGPDGDDRRDSAGSSTRGIAPRARADRRVNGRHARSRSGGDRNSAARGPRSGYGSWTAGGS